MAYVHRNQLLLSTSYNLSSSFTKQVVVGVEYNKENKELNIKVKLISSHPQASLSFSFEEWKFFSSYFKEIYRFFNQKLEPFEIDCDAFYIRSIKYLNSRFIIVRKASEQQTDLVQQFSQQIDTFTVLKQLDLCIKQNLKELHFIPLQCTKNIIIKTIGQLIYERCDLDNANSLENFVKEKASKILEKILRKISYQDLGSFERFFYEITTFHVKDVCEEILINLTKIQKLGTNFFMVNKKILECKYCFVIYRYK